MLEALDRLMKGRTTFVIAHRLSTVRRADLILVVARVVDLVVAVHDYAKVYGDPGSDAYKVPLDLTVARTFLRAYEKETDEPLTSAEIETLPAFLTAKRLKRALGRFERAVGGEPLSLGDVRKIGLELARARWLQTHREELRDLLGAGV